MCAWRYNNNNGTSAASNGLVPSGALPLSTGLGTFGGASSAGAFLRQNATAGAPGALSLQRPLGSASTSYGGAAASSAGGGHVVYSDEEDEEDEDDQAYDPPVRDTQRLAGRTETTAPSRAVPSLALGGGAASQGPVGSSLAGALLRNAGAAPASAVGFRGAATGNIGASMGGFQAASLARKLFKAPGDVGPSAYSDNDEEEEELLDLTDNDRDFVYNTRDLFDEVDPNLLAEDFVPHEHVVDIIASEETGGEASPDEIADKLDPYIDLQEEIDMYLGDYIEEHHEEFNTAISDFSEMILAVSGSDDTLARLKVQLAEAASSLEDHSEQLSALRLRAAKSLFMTEILQNIQDALSREVELKKLVAGRHYLAAVTLLEKHRQCLLDEQLVQVRSTQDVRDFAAGLATTLHAQIVDDLLACVFRQERLQEADSQVLQEMLSVGDGEAITGDTRAAAPNVQRTVKKYWSAVKSRRGDANDSEGTDGNTDGSGEPAASAGGDGTAAAGTLAAIAESVFDDPNDDTISKDYLRFVPLCVRSLILLDKLDLCHEAFFSKATRSIERFIAHFLRLYDAWRRKALVSGGSATEQNADSAVRAIRVKAFDLITDTCSSDEAVATIQARELRALLTALFTELEKILRNADYLHKIVLVSFYPFTSDDLTKPGPFDVDATCEQWTVDDHAMHDADQFRDIVQGALDFVQRKIHDMEDAATAESILSRFGEFFTVDRFFLACTTTQTQAEAPSPGAAPAATASSSSPPAAPPLSGAGPSGANVDTQQPTQTFTVRALERFLQSSVKATIDKYGTASMRTSALQFIEATLLEEVRHSLREILAEQVKSLQAEWDLTPLWAQLNYHMELVFHVLCDAKSAEDDSDDLVTLQPFLRQKNLTQRVQRAAANVREAERIDDTATLDKLLSSFQSGGLLRMIEETGPVSFSIVGAVRKAQNDVRKANAGQARQFQAMHSDTARLNALVEAGVGGGGGGGEAGAGPPIVLLQASTLQSWFVFTAMNVLTCYQCASRFCDRCRDRAPEVLRAQSEDETVIGFFKRFIRSTYIPTLHAFHSEQLRLRFVEMGDMVADAPVAAEPEEKAAATPGQAPKTAAPTGGSAKGAGTDGTPKTAWPTVSASGTTFPVLSCVWYVGQVLEKVAALRRVLPFSIVDDVEQSTSEALITELSVFLKRRVQLLGRGTIQYRLLNAAFEDAFAGLPNASWATLCNESRLLLSQRGIDHNLYLYYQYNSEERTSGHEYNEFDDAVAAAALEKDRDDVLDRRIGMIPAKDLSLHDDSAIVGLAVLSFSTEWLCDVVLRFLWPGGNRTAQDYTDSAVPGYLFATQLAVADSLSADTGTHTGAHLVRLSGHLLRLCSLSQVSLFYLTIETRFCAFQYLPQLRDESYSTVATSSSADNFVQAYARRLNTIYSLLRQHLSRKKIKYTCLTIAEPASELILSELAHLRDKGISAAGLSRLRTNLMLLQTALQLILPTDTDVRSAVGRFFTRPAVFVRYISNRDVVNDLVSSGDYRMFTTSEVECLIRLVFRQVSGANDDSLANKNIALFQSKLKAIQELRTGTIQQSSRLTVPGGIDSVVSTSTSRRTSTVRSGKHIGSDDDEEEEDYLDDELGGNDGVTLQPSQSKRVITKQSGVPPVVSSAATGPTPPPSKIAGSVNPGAPPNATAKPTPPSDDEEEEEEYEEEEEEEEEEVAHKATSASAPAFTPPVTAPKLATPLPTTNRYAKVAMPPPYTAPTRATAPAPIAGKTPLTRHHDPQPSTPTLASKVTPPPHRSSSSSEYEYEEEEEEEEYEYEEEEEEEQVVAKTPAKTPVKAPVVPSMTPLPARQPLSSSSKQPLPPPQPRPVAAKASSESSYEYEEVTEETEEEEESGDERAFRR